MNEFENVVRSLHIMVVDDERFMRSLLVRLLRELGVGRISEAENGQDALDYLLTAKTGVDIILLDLEMPEVNGFQFVKELHSTLPETKSELPIIVISGLGDEESVAAVRALGLKLFLLKPISKLSLISRICAALKIPDVTKKQ